ncbi:MAG: ATP-binding protein [Chloroflexi bacterium]|nr:ATP-binding protein [Chloroflexota bacterium]
MPPLLLEAQVRDRLERLRLRQMATVLDRVCAEASTADRGYLDFLDRLLEAELGVREERGVEARTRLAHLPFRKTLADFDFGFQPGLDKQQVQELFTLRFVTAAENVLLLGPPGVGKTHLAVALALAAIHHGAEAYFITLPQLVDYLSSGTATATAKLKVLLRPKVLVIDELGYLPLDRTAANGLFDLVSRRYERGSIILTSNKSYGEWGSVFPEVAIASALLDRLLHHATTITIRGDRYRLKDKRRAGVFHRLDNEPSTSSG